MNIDSEILITLLRTGGGNLSINLIHQRLNARIDDGVVWRDVAKAVTRLINLGHLRVAGEVQIGIDMYPTYELTPTGEVAAHAASREQRNSAVLGTPKTEHDSAGERAS